MNPQELIEYILADFRKAMEANKPDDFLNEAQGLDYFWSLMEQRYAHLREAMFQAWMVERKAEK